LIVGFGNGHAAAGFGEGGLGAGQATLGLGDVGDAAGAGFLPLVEHAEDVLVIAHVLLRQAVEDALAIDLHVGDDRIEGNRLGIVKDAQFGGIELGFLDADPAGVSWPSYSS